MQLNEITLKARALAPAPIGVTGRNILFHFLTTIHPPRCWVLPPSYARG